VPKVLSLEKKTLQLFFFIFLVPHLYMFHGQPRGETSNRGRLLFKLLGKLQQCGNYPSCCHLKKNICVFYDREGFRLDIYKDQIYYYLLGMEIPCFPSAWYTTEKV
jgi:hypothetical protein